MSSEFVVSVEKRDIILKRLPQIQDVFDVRVQCGDPDGSRCGDSGCILPTVCDPDAAADTSTAASIAPMWIQVVGDSKQKCEKAKEYILSVCSDQRIEEEYPQKTLDMLDGRIPQLEYESGAVIERLPGDKLRIQGSDESIVKAQSLISIRTNVGSGGCVNSAIESDQSGSRIIRTRTDFSDCSHPTQDDEVPQRLRPLENGNATEAIHPDLQPKAVPSSTSVSSSSSSSTTNSRKNHDDIIALMLKLGYSREIFEQVLVEMGDEASSDEVLRRLVKMGSAPEEGSGDSKDMDGTSGRQDFSDGVEEQEESDADPYRPIIIDGSNVAMSYGNSNIFDCEGIDTVVKWFHRRGHSIIYVIVPSWRKEQSKPETPIKNQELLVPLEKAKILVWTPSRRLKGRRIVCYDDRYVLNLAMSLDGIVVSNDTFRDLAAEKPDYRKVVEERLLMYSFAGKKFMPPDDPLGRRGPNLENFLRKTPIKASHQMQPCPYGKKCTYGNKCKYSHPERSKNVKTTSEILVEKDRLRQEQKLKEKLMARALKADMVEMPWEREERRGGNLTEPLPMDERLMHQRGAASQHGGALTLPLRNPPMVDNGYHTVPLSGPQHMQQVQQVPQYRGHPQNVQSVNDPWMTSDHRIHAASYHPHQPQPRVQSTNHHHPAPGQLSRNQPLPNRAMTAPLPSFAPHPQPTRDMMTAPLSTPDYYQAPQQPGKRLSLPQGGGVVSQQQRPPPPPQPSHHRERTDLSHEFHQLSMHDTTSHVGAFDEERHYSYPLTTPYRGNPPAKPPSNLYLEDEGCNSPLTPNDQGIPSPLPPSLSSRYAVHPNVDSSMHPTGQSRPPRFMYPTSSPSPSSSSAAYGLPPSSSQAPPGSTHQFHGGMGGADQQRHGGHMLVQSSRHMSHPADGHRRTSEPVPPRQGWEESWQERPRREDELIYREMMRRGSSGLSGQP